MDMEKLTTSRPYFDKKRELEEMQDYRRLLTRKMNIEKTDLNLPRSAQVEIIEAAVPDIKPVRPKKTLNIVLGVVIGLVVGVGLAFFIEYLDTSVKTPLMTWSGCCNRRCWVSSRKMSATLMRKARRVRTPKPIGCYEPIYCSRARTTS